MDLCPTALLHFARDSGVTVVWAHVPRGFLKVFLAILDSVYTYETLWEEDRQACILSVCFWERVAENREFSSLDWKVLYHGKGRPPLSNPAQGDVSLLISSSELWCVCGGGDAHSSSDLSLPQRAQHPRNSRQLSPCTPLSDHTCLEAVTLKD